MILTSNTNNWIYKQKMYTYELKNKYKINFIELG